MTTKSTVTFVNLEKYLQPQTYVYEVKGFGHFELQNLTHREVRELQAEYQTPTGIPHFPELKDQLILKACVTPKFTPESLAAWTGGVDVLDTLGQHIGHKCGWLTNPPDQDIPKPVKAGDAATGDADPTPPSAAPTSTST